VLFVRPLALCFKAKQLTASSYLMIFRVTAIFCLMLAAAMLLPLVVDLESNNPDWKVFALTAVLVAFISIYVIVVTNGRKAAFNLATGFLLINVLWLVSSIVAALPYIFSAYHVTFTDALFESVSGLTTTGSTVLSQLEQMPHGLLLWRSLTQWLGGLGFVAMGILLLPFLRDGGMKFFKLESSDRADKPVARIETFSKMLVTIYVILTVACILGFGAAGMGWFDAINHAMTTISTGGFSTRDASMMEANNAELIVGCVFMLAGALPFTLYMWLMFRTGGNWKDTQISVLLWLISGLTLLLIIFATFPVGFSVSDKVIHSLFNIISLVTTTGFASADYLTWGPSIIGVIMIATFIGGSAGSTAGGFKTYRVIILMEVIWVALKKLKFPNGVFPVFYRDKQVTSSGIGSFNDFLSAFIAIWLVGTVALTFTGLDFETAFSGALTALCNVGPGWGGQIGPSGNFAAMSDPAKWILTAMMLLGRLELMTMLVVFTPTFWQE
jgi:trk system potassium uptake protein TrkH